MAGANEEEEEEKEDKEEEKVDYFNRILPHLDIYDTSISLTVAQYKKQIAHNALLEYNGPSGKVKEEALE